MSKSLITAFSFLAIQAFACVSYSTVAISKPDPKAQLGIQEGVYTVSKQTTTSEDPFCYAGSSYTVAWIGTAKDPILSIGSVQLFADFNKGLQTDSEPTDKNHCVYKTNTQTESAKLTIDTFTNCDHENITEKTEITIARALGAGAAGAGAASAGAGVTLNYRHEKKILRKGKVIAVTSSCVLKLKR